MNRTALVTGLLACCPTAFANTVALDFIDRLGTGEVLLGSHATVVVLGDFVSTPLPLTQLSVSTSYDTGRMALAESQFRYNCTAPGAVCDAGTDNGLGTVTNTVAATPNGLPFAVINLRFSTNAIGVASFDIDHGTSPTLDANGGTIAPASITFEGTTVEVVASETCYLEDFDPAAAGGALPPGWTTFTTTALATLWETTAGQACGLGNVTGGSADAACIRKSEPDILASRLCSPAIDLSGATDALLEFRYNFQILPAPPPRNFRTFVGTDLPGPATIDNYTELLSRATPAGAAGALPGSINNAALPVGETVYVCFAFIGNSIDYAQVDDVTVFARSCGFADSDGDGITDNNDNCTAVANPDQRDTDADGYGNVCDADFNADCAINLLDVAVMKNHFFAAGDLDTDLDGDGNTNFIDLGILKALVFGPPGPSGITNTCE